MSHTLPRVDPDARRALGRVDRAEDIRVLGLDERRAGLRLDLRAGDVIVELSGAPTTWIPPARSRRLPRPQQPPTPIVRTAPTRAPAAPRVAPSRPRWPDRLPRPRTVVTSVAAAALFAVVATAGLRQSPPDVVAPAATPPVTAPDPSQARVGSAGGLTAPGSVPSTVPPPAPSTVPVSPPATSGEGALPAPATTTTVTEPASADFAGAVAAAEAYLGAIGSRDFGAALALAGGPAADYAAYLLDLDRVAPVNVGTMVADIPDGAGALLEDGRVALGGRATFALSDGSGFELHDFVLAPEGDGWLLDEFARDGYPIGDLIDGSEIGPVSVVGADLVVLHRFLRPADGGWTMIVVYRIDNGGQVGLSPFAFGGDFIPNAGELVALEFFSEPFVVATGTSALDAFAIPSDAVVGGGMVVGELEDPASGDAWDITMELPAVTP